ncbi:hypothetical protein ACU5AX_20690 [Sphingomonas sp. XXL09]|uniref:hypothetical protein n=1 Tax=Sphingomonas sp. XXL09 TaxID=3457787 RepID=UPI00406BA431
MNVNALKANQWLRMTLARYAANSGMDGWIFAYLEGEYNPETGMIQLHWHLIMTRSPTRAVIKRLREHRAFRREVGSHNNPDGIDVRVMVKCIDTGTLPHAISYVTKGAWYSKRRAFDENNGRKTQRRKGRIPEPAHTAVLRWLDRWKLGDMAMLLNLHVTKSGITPR